MLRGCVVEDLQGVDVDGSGGTVQIARSLRAQQDYIQAEIAATEG
jgi:hypothetical protein